MDAGEEEVRLPCNQAEFEAVVVGSIAQMRPAIIVADLKRHDCAAVTDAVDSGVGCFARLAGVESVGRLFDDVTGPLDGPTIQLKSSRAGESGFPSMRRADPRQTLLEVCELSADLRSEVGAWPSDDHVRARPLDAISFAFAEPLDRPLGLNEDPTPYYAGDR